MIARYNVINNIVMYVNLEMITLKGHKLKQLLSVLLRQRHMAESYIINPKQVSMVQSTQATIYQPKP